MSLWGQYYAYFQFKEETRLIEIKNFAQSYGVGQVCLIPELSTTSQVGSPPTLGV